VVRSNNVTDSVTGLTYSHLIKKKKVDDYSGLMMLSIYRRLHVVADHSRTPTAGGMERASGSVSEICWSAVASILASNFFRRTISCFNPAVLSSRCLVVDLHPKVTH
jgi:hypothetical protein